MSRHALLAALLKREMAAAWLVTLGATILVAAGAARMAPGLVDGAGPDLTGRFIRRFDLTAMGLCAVLASIRIAQRTAADQASGWLDPYMAAGGSRRAYGVTLAAAVSLATSAWFGLAAITFAIGIRVTAGSAELLRELPVLLLGGLLLVTSFTVFAGVFAQVTREAVSALMLTGTAFAVPYVLVMVWLQGTGTVPEAVRWLVLAVPRPFAPETWLGAVVGVIHVLAAGAIVASLSHRLAGRRA
jgi:hypothetical protein